MAFNCRSPKGWIELDQIKPVLQDNEYDCGICCIRMFMQRYGVKPRGLDYLRNQIDGINVRQVEAFLRENGFEIFSGNFTLGLMKWSLYGKMPIIALLEHHYVVIVGYETRSRKVQYLCPIEGKKSMAIAEFKKRWRNFNDGAAMIHWGICGI